METMIIIDHLPFKKKIYLAPPTEKIKALFLLSKQKKFMCIPAKPQHITHTPVNINYKMARNIMGNQLHLTM